MTGRAAIARLIPHAGRMVLLDAVVGWTEDAIQCTTRSHLEPTHPLRGPDGLSSMQAIEYMAQAAAVHGALLLDNRAAPERLLAAVRDVRLAVARLDDLKVPLDVRAERLSGDEAAVIYAGTVHAGASRIASARMTLVAVGNSP